MLEGAFQRERISIVREEFYGTSWPPLFFPFYAFSRNNEVSINKIPFDQEISPPNLIVTFVWTQGLYSSQQFTGREWRPHGCQSHTRPIRPLLQPLCAPC